MHENKIAIIAFLLIFTVSLGGCGTVPGPGECETPPCDQNGDCVDPPCDEEGPDDPPDEICEQDPDFVAGEPIVATAGEWTWVDIEGTRCMGGTATGLAVNPHPEATGTLIYMQGGGLCFDFTTCSQVANPNGFGSADFAAMNAAGYMNIGIFNRSDPTNPFQRFNLVFIPYCSGDLFGGDLESGFQGRTYAGLQNHQLFLERLVPTFEESGPVVLAGSSAGAYGASINYHRSQLAFGCTPVHLLNDAGPIFSDTYTRPCFQTLLRDSFGLDAALPAECEACFGEEGGGMGELLSFLAERHPERRFAMLTRTQDQVIRYFMGYGYSATCASATLMPGSEFEAGVLELRDGDVAAHDNTAMFIMAGTDHVFLGGRPSSTVVAGVSLAAWLGAMLGDDPSWESVGP